MVVQFVFSTTHGAGIGVLECLHDKAATVCTTLSCVTVVQLQHLSSLFSLPAPELLHPKSDVTITID